MRTNYCLIDIAKVYCALLVVFIHAYDIRTSIRCDAILYGLTNQAVPLFFLVSGFFFSKKIKNNDNEKKMVKKQCCHFLLLYLSWCLICSADIIQTYSDESLIRMIILVLRRVLCAGYSVYWYLLVLAESFFVIYYLLKLNTRNMLVVIICGLVLGICYDLNLSVGIVGLINRVFYTIFSWNNNMVMKGIPFVALGVLIEKYEKEIYKINRWYWILLYITINALGVALYWIGFQNVSVVVFQPEAILLLLVCISDKDLRLSDLFCRILRGYSSCLYYLHPIIIWMVIERICGAHSALELKYFGAILISMAIFAIIWLINMKPVNWLFSIKH